MHVFASPGNRQVTGPIDRFAEMLLSGPPYAPLVSKSQKTIGSEVIRDDVATVVVTVRDERQQVVAFRFILARQTEGPVRGCWMTEGVMSSTSEPVPDANSFIGTDV